MRKLILALAVAMLASLAVFADIPRPTNSPTPKPTATPKHKKSIETDLHISLVKTETARLKISKSEFSKLRAQLDELEDGSDNTAAVTGSGAPTPGSFANIQTVVAGGFLSLALVFGGLWFARGRMPKAVKTTAAGALLFLGGAAATAVIANVGPPLEARSITGKIFSEHVHMYKQASGPIKLIITDDQNVRGVELEVPDPKGFPDRGE